MRRRREKFTPAPGVEWELEKQPDHFEVGLSVDGSNWSWHGLDAKAWPSARKKGPSVAAAMIREVATGLRLKASRLVRRADELDDVASKLGGSDG